MSRNFLLFMVKQNLPKFQIPTTLKSLHIFYKERCKDLGIQNFLGVSEFRYFRCQRSRIVFDILIQFILALSSINPRDQTYEIHLKNCNAQIINGYQESNNSLYVHTPMKSLVLFNTIVHLYS